MQSTLLSRHRRELLTLQGDCWVMRYLQVILLALTLLFAGCTLKYQKTGTPVTPPAESAVQQAATALAKPIPGNNSSSQIALPPLPAEAPLQLGTLPALPPSPLSENSSVTRALEILHSSLPTIHYYYSPSCPYSIRVSPQIEKLMEKYAGKIQWEKFDVLTQEGYDAFDRMINENGLGNSSRVVPIVVAGNRTFIGIEEISNGLDKQAEMLSAG